MRVKRRYKGSRPNTVKHINFKKVDWGKIITAVLITVLSVTAWINIRDRTNQAQVEKQLNTQIELKEHKLNELNKTNEATLQERENLKKETEELKKQLQAKREKQAKDKVYAESLGVTGNKYDWLTQAGIPQDQWACANSLITKESGWRVNAYNPSGAYGIPQSLPGNKMASVGADWQTNPVTQLIWMRGYVNARYGSFCGAWGHSQANNWY